jgi:hypothetical protein
LIARATLTPPPPGSNIGSVQCSFFSGTSFFTEAVLSMQGLNVIVTIAAMPQSKMQN